jgi:hypothetical protein
MDRLRQNPRGHTAALLLDTPLGARVILALASIGPDAGGTPELTNKRTADR